jgi:hypothetical protein
MQTLQDEKEMHFGRMYHLQAFVWTGVAVVAEVRQGQIGWVLRELFETHPENPSSIPFKSL